MDNLISGLIGAIIATIITVVYSHIAELIRRRHDVTLEVVGYSDDVYGHLQTMHVYKRQQAEGKDTLDKDEYKTASRELRNLVVSSRVHARAALVYGEKSSELKSLQLLRGHFIEAARLLWNANPNNWNETNTALWHCLEKQIDPLRAKTEIQFIRSVRIINVLKDLVLNLCPSKSNEKNQQSA